MIGPCKQLKSPSVLLILEFYFCKTIPGVAVVGINVSALSIAVNLIRKFSQLSIGIP